MPTFTVNNGYFYKDGTAFQLKGISWSGGESNNLFPHCWNNSYQAMVLKFKNSGGNFIRFPITKEIFDANELTGVNGAINTSYPDNVAIKNIQPLLAFDTLCNYLASQQIYFIFDWHTPQKAQVPGTAAFGQPFGVNGITESQWIGYMTQLATRYANNSYFLGIEPANEPHRFKWDDSLDSTNWRRAAEVCGQAILNANSNILVFIEGVADHQSNCPVRNTSFMNWGTELRAFECFPIRPNFIPKNKLVLCPHPYGPDVLYNYNNNFANLINSSNFPNNFQAEWQNQFGFLADLGYTICYTEYGGMMVDKTGNTTLNLKDKTFQYALIDWSTTKNIFAMNLWMLTNEGGDTSGLLKDDMSTYNPETNTLFQYQTNKYIAPLGSGGGGTTTTAGPTLAKIYIYKTT